MNTRVKALLLPFYFGSIKDDERVLVEREMLVDSEILLDYLDLKRSLESVEAMPSEPSAVVWDRLKQSVMTRRKLFLSLSFGAAAIFLLVFSLWMLKPSSSLAPTEVSHDSVEILFDSKSELPINSNVL